MEMMHSEIFYEKPNYVFKSNYIFEFELDSYQFFLYGIALIQRLKIKNITLLIKRNHDQITFA